MEHTCFSLSVSAFHSSANNLLASVTEISLKSPELRRSLQKKVHADRASFTRRSSLMGFKLAGIDRTTFFARFMRPRRSRALLA